MTIWNRGFSFVFYDEDLSFIRAPKSDLSGGNGVENVSLSWRITII